MATMTTGSSNDRSRVCFSFAAYSKNLIDHLKTCKIPVLDGLSDEEFASIESEFGFVFPPDLQSILREGLPIGAGFPNWRSSSSQQLEFLVNLPTSGLCNEISKGNFWCQRWGSKPENEKDALILAKRFLKSSPVLVPIYLHCYMPAQPSDAGNPVFYVRGADFRYAGYDVAGFFDEVVFRPAGWGMRAPAWAAKAARRIDFWSELVEVTSRRGRVRRGKCLEGLAWMLREGGWKEEEVREMMDGQDALVARAELRDRGSVIWYVRLLSLTLTKAGWSKEDVAYALGLHDLVGPSLFNGGSVKTDHVIHI